MFSEIYKPQTLGTDFAALVDAVSAVDPEMRIRFTSPHPKDFPPQLVELIASRPNVCNSVHMPEQSGSSAVLSRMRRGGSAEGHLALLSRFRGAMPEAALRTTLIVGFPGETDREFDELCSFVNEARFDHLGVFTYSHEDGTTAGELEDDVPAALKQERRTRLMELQQQICLEHNRRRIGRTYEVVVEGPHPDTEHLLVGRMSTQALDVDGQIWINDGVAQPGDFVPVELTEVAGYDVVGRIVEPD